MLAGAENLLTQHSPAIVMETGRYSLRYGVPPTQAIAQLREFGYDTVVRWKDSRFDVSPLDAANDDLLVGENILIIRDLSRYPRLTGAA